MLTKPQQQFLRHAITQFSNEHKINLKDTSFFNFSEKKKLKNNINWFKNITNVLDDKQDVLDRMSKYDIATLANVALEVYDCIKEIPNATDDSNLVKDFQLSMECIEVLNSHIEKI
ncbi:MAG TPA: hypothetical protein VLZ29_09075 [Sulfurimonas sp.]|uniref:hypothetical protein n=1 Tax=Sulfurimonas sp. TaxID=2022749 RepID=UPI002C2BE57E|nr:hypothetical protein [Sulfurimonas sp.]HUH43258.1 hypothetical protein [Sulfurimonas sp.]